MFQKMILLLAVALFVSKGLSAQNASDPKAVEIAGQVMKAMGGQKNWDKTRFVAWTFFGRRRLWWDKHEGLVRIESFADSTIYLVDVGKETGTVKRKGVVLEHVDSIAKYVKRGKSMWLNDAYWLFMPYKMMDPGVTLRHLGTEALAAGNQADVLQLTFENVGDTPENRYKVYIDQRTHLVVQWDYFAKASDAEPRISNSWDNYSRYGKILLSGDRGKRGKLDDIAVWKKMP
ncbi:MAG: hypothetical protein HUU01_20700, partial [Saprospiraceae bacterium]|nr:hypothetical protein [Saprospiraceae bacterium]